MQSTPRSSLQNKCTLLPYSPLVLSAVPSPPLHSKLHSSIELKYFWEAFVSLGGTDFCQDLSGPKKDLVSTERSRKLNVSRSKNLRLNNGLDSGPHLQNGSWQTPTAIHCLPAGVVACSLPADQARTHPPKGKERGRRDAFLLFPSFLCLPQPLA